MASRARLAARGTTRRTCDAQDGRRPDGRVGAGLTGGAWAAPDASEQLQYESFVVAAGASNGAARVCGASEPDLKQHQDTSRKNLQRYAQEYGFNAQNYDTLFDKGLDQGKAMMEEMKRSGVDGCRGVLGSFRTSASSATRT